MHGTHAASASASTVSAGMGSDRSMKGSSMSLSWLQEVQLTRCSSWPPNIALMKPAGVSDVDCSAGRDIADFSNVPKLPAGLLTQMQMQAQHAACRSGPILQHLCCPVRFREILGGRIKGIYAVTCNEDIAWLLQVPASNVQEGSRGRAPHPLPCPVYRQASETATAPSSA